MLFWIEDAVSRTTKFETDVVEEVKQWIDSNTVLAPDGKRYPAFVVYSERDFTSDEMAMLGLGPVTRYYDIFRLVGGPKDGHTVKVPRRKDGSATTKLYRRYKVRKGVAWYRFNTEADCYEYSETERQQ